MQGIRHAHGQLFPHTWTFEAKIMLSGTDGRVVSNIIRKKQ